MSRKKITTLLLVAGVTLALLLLPVVSGCGKKAPTIETTTSLVVSGYPSPTTAGVAHNVTITAQDASGNTATGYTGTVHITSSDGSAVLPANYTFLSGDNGVHALSVTLKTAGTQSITATDTVTSSITGTQSGITVNPAP